MTGDDDTALSPEEVQIIRALTVGGHGEFPVRAYYQVLDLILSRVPIPLKDIRPSTNGERRGRQGRIHGRIRVYRGIACAALEALQQGKVDNQNAKRRQRRRERSAIMAARRAGFDAAADSMEVDVQQQRRVAEEQREFQRWLTDEVTMNVKKAIGKRLRGERLERVIGDTLVALQLAGSSEPAAVKQRFRRMPPELKPYATRPAKPTT